MGSRSEAISIRINVARGQEAAKMNMASFVPPSAFYTFDGGFVTRNEGAAFERKC